MPVLKITSVALDYVYGSTGIVYFICSDGSRKKTPELQPAVFSAVCNVLLYGETEFDTDTSKFRSLGYIQSGLVPTKKSFKSSDFENLDSFEIIRIPNS